MKRLQGFFSMSLKTNRKIEQSYINGFQAMQIHQNFSSPSRYEK